MASFLHVNYGSWSHEISAKDLVKYICIAVVACLGIAGLLQNIASNPDIEKAPSQSRYGTGVYTNK